jgi:hypothetical protein
MVEQWREPKDWYPLFPNPVLAEGILDRLINSSHQVVMRGKSYRPQQRPGRPDGSFRIRRNAQLVSDRKTPASQKNDAPKCPRTAAMTRVRLLVPRRP